ncbi:MAG: AMP-binding protein [Verrucomicrobia bacterium]|nr:AMP-binding protein [Verrucomicrobiota bacterium]
MDAALLTDPGFWADLRPYAPGDFPGAIPALAGLGGQVLFETSGSTGPPQWLALSKPALLLSAAAVNQHLRVADDSCWGLALPLHHVGGFGVVARAFEAACRLQHFSRRWQPQEFQAWLRQHGVTHTSLVPAQVHDLVAARLPAPPSLLAIVVGGGRLDGLTGQAARQLGWPVLASYGMTETASQIATQGLELLANPYQPAPLEILPLWETRASGEGRLSIAGPALFSGTLHHCGEGWDYHARAGAWHLTSDRVVLADGHLTPLGRMDAVVKVLGELVDPVAIENELLALASGVLAPGSFAIVAVPDERAGHCLVPVFESSVDPAIVAAALAGYQNQAPGFRRLQAPLMVAALPRSPLGKLRRPALAEVVRDARRNHGRNPPSDAACIRA